MYTAILLSGGIGKRMHNTVPKQYMLLAGKPVIMHTLERMDRIAEIGEIVIVCTDEYVESIQLMINQYGIRKTVKFAKAGNSRQASVQAGVKMVKTENVIIHEAARPFVKTEDFMKLIQEENRNALYGISIPFTVIKGHDFLEGILDRSELINVQLPQKFETELLKKAHLKAEEEGKLFTEDASLVHHYFPDKKIKICEGMEYDIKLTTRQDMLIGEMIYNEIFRGRK